MSNAILVACLCLQTLCFCLLALILLASFGCKRT